MNFFDEAEASTSLLMQCGYRRKANLNQQRLHKRQREKRAAQQLCESVEKDLEHAEDHPTKKARLSVEPIMHWPTNGTCYYGLENLIQHSSVGASGPTVQRMGSQDMDILELLLVDMQSLPPLESLLPRVSAVPANDENFAVM
ncbi:hypothetical protein PR001_g24295 [Phytophthora rubi]|uniref:Uncharacterized protein n=1 Tax=Phytophthora rubi TaxID=129364 RepID=A0A6A3IBS4_9STRA|nr:hypothetical protein PR001_g24295 [Phytophthora rubi]